MIEALFSSVHQCEICLNAYHLETRNGLMWADSAELMDNSPKLTRTIHKIKSVLAVRQF